MAAIAYAKKYAINPNSQYKYFKLIGDNSGDCANFISQCLYSGGAPMLFNQNPWWYKNNKCSSSWSVAHELYWFLKLNYVNKAYGVKGFEITSLDYLELGDLIFFENNKKVIFHSAIITELNRPFPLISQHTPNAFNLPYTNSWSAYKYHFIKILL